MVKVRHRWVVLRYKGQYFFCTLVLSFRAFFLSENFTSESVLFFNMEKHAEEVFLRKMIKKLFFPKFRSVHMNWHKCNDNFNKLSKLATNDNITTALYMSFYEISAQLGSYQQLRP